MLDDDDAAPEAVAIGSHPRPVHAAAVNEDIERPQSCVPVTLITGFLGSGKTSLVQHILTGQHGYRIAVIMNEFGESVEGSYFETPEGSKAHLGEWVDLANGCMCCAVKSEFVQAIETLMKHKRANFDYILIESTGLANPGPIAQAIWTDEELEAGVQLDAIVTVVDAINVDKQLNEARAPGVTNEAQVQIGYADIILLNKMDLAAEEAVQRAKADVLAINSSAEIICTRHCAVDLALILNRNNYNGLGPPPSVAVELDTIDEAAEEAGQEEEEISADAGGRVGASGAGGAMPLTPGQPAVRSNDGKVQRQRSMRRSRSKSRSRAKITSDHSSHSSGGGGHSSHGEHDTTIQSTTLRSSKPLDLEKFKSFIDKLLWDREIHPEEIYRCKGLVNVAGSTKKHVLQAVYESYNIKPTSEWAAGEVRGTVVVIIGRGIKKAKLEEWFEACQEDV